VPAPLWFRRQLAGPSGWLARPMARLLDRFNGPDVRAAVARLAPGPGDRALELGFGGGAGIDALLATGAEVVGVEPTRDMRRRAFRRFADALADERLHIVAGAAEALPDGPFSHALSMNTVYFWSSVPEGMAELARVVDGVVVLGVAHAEHLQQMGFAEAGYRVEEPGWYAEQLRRVGFVTEVVPAPGAERCNLVVGRR